MNDGGDFEPPAKTVIIGNAGRMGRMLEQHAAEAGLDVTGIDQPLTDESLAQALPGADMALLCVPARHLEEVTRKIAPFLPEAAILSDITSVKEAPMKQMQKYWHGPVVGTHPLFGPGAEPDQDLRVAIVPGKNASPEDAGRVAAFFQAPGFRTFQTSAEKHDQAMAKIQNMNFIRNLAYFVKRVGEEDHLPYHTPSFDRRRQAAQKMLTEDAEMFAGLFEANPHSHEAVRQYRRILNLAASGDIDLLCHRAQWWWKQDRASGRD